MRHAAKIDDNQPEIIKALKAISVAVEYIKKPLDLLIAHPLWCPNCKARIPGHQTSLMEVKNPLGKNEYTKDQVEFIARWPGRILVARSPEDAVNQVIGEQQK